MKTCLLILMQLLLISAFGQKAAIELTFTAENNGQYVPMDSIYIENLTQGGDTTLYIPDTILVLDYITSIGDNQATEENSFSVSQNYPNPFKGKTEFNLYLAEKELIKITVRDIVGKELVHYDNILNSGTHTFDFYAGNEKYYLFSVIGKQTSRTIKMLNANSSTTFGEKCKIVYSGNKGNVSGFKSQQAINDFVYNLGDELKYTAYTDFEESEIINSPIGNQTFTFQFDGWTPCSGSSAVTDIDGNIYNTVQIGNRCWMKENLKTTTYQNGTPIPNVTDPNEWENLTTGAYVWYDNDILWKDLYGGLYNWHTTIDTNGLCPTGWHLSTHIEWIILTNFIGGANYPHGHELKSCRQVYSPLGGDCTTSNHPRWDHDFMNNANYGTDDYGFSGFPGSNRAPSGNFGNVGSMGIWWSSTEHSSIDAWRNVMSYLNGNISMAGSSKQHGFSVRCLKD